jgi:VIT1/CCC1 family predicted Fe2+/Mn2+ transporter
MNAQKAPGASPRSGELAAEVVHDVNRLVGLEIALAKQELKELAIRNAIAAACIAAGGLFAILALLVALPVTIVMLVPWHWQAAAVWAVVYVLLTAALVLYGRARLQITVPPRTLASLKETKTWALQRMRSTGR